MKPDEWAELYYDVIAAERGLVTQLSLEQLDSMSPAERLEAHRRQEEFDVKMTKLKINDKVKR